MRSMKPVSAALKVVLISDQQQMAEASTAIQKTEAVATSAIHYAYIAGKRIGCMKRTIIISRFCSGNDHTYTYQEGLSEQQQHSALL